VLPDLDELVDRRGTHSMKWDVAPGELPMWVADMDFRAAPEITEALARKVRSGVFGYGVVPDAYARSVAGWWRRRHGFDMSAEWVTLTTGVVPAISSMVRTLTRPADQVVVLTPVYNIFFNCVRNSGREVLSSALRATATGWEIDWHDLERGLADPRTTLLIFCNPQNPTGTVWDPDTLRRVGDLCARYHVPVISDEVHCDLTAPGVLYTPFAAASATCASISITCVAPTKAFNLAGLQTASVVVPDRDVRAAVVAGLNRDEVAEPNAFAVEATIAAFTHGEPWLDHVRAYLAANKEHAAQAVVRIPGLRATASAATYLLWIDVSDLTDDSSELAVRIRDRTGLVLSDGAAFYPGGPSHLRMNLACPRSRVDDGLERLARAIEPELVSAR
jgi:cystathionine beta-lyase